MAGARDRQWKLRDLIAAAALAVPLGVFWSYAWGLAWQVAADAVPQLGDVMDGFYVVGGVLVAYVIRRPGAALLGELIASLVEIPFTSFGPVVLWLGLLQGLGVEAVLLGTGYRHWRLSVLLIAGAAGSLVALVGYYYPVEGWLELALALQVLRITLKLVGGAVLGGLAGKLIGDALAQTGVLNNFPIARARTRQI